MDPLLHDLLPSFVGVIVGGVAAFVGIRVGMATMKEWREVKADPMLDRHEVRITLIGGDVDAFDTELANLHDHLKIRRPKRPRRLQNGWLDVP
jgi:hypothetical protein